MAKGKALDANKILQNIVLGTAFCLCLHSAALAEVGAAINAAPLPAQATGLSEPPQNGIIVAGDGIFFDSGTVLIVPAVSGANATEGPTAGPADYLGGTAPDASTYREAVP